MRQRKKVKRYPVDLFKRNLKNITIVLVGLVFSVLIFIAVDYQSFVYPPEQAEQPSPKNFIIRKFQSSPQQALKPEVIEHGPRNKKVVALTFDADMTPGMLALLQKGVVKSWYNKPIKDTLDRENVPATIFLTGLWVKAYPQEAKELAQDKLIEIGNHSYAHPAFTKSCFKLPFLSESAVDEVEQAQKEIVAVTGVTPKYFRFPGGCYDKVNLETVAKLGLKVVHWDVISGDGFNPNTQSIINKVESQVQNGSIIVFHIHGGPNAPKTNDALEKIIPDLKKRGFQFVTVSELLRN